MTKNLNQDPTNWWTVKNVEEIASPALLIYPERIEENIRRMIALAGGVARLRPHIKTHKLAEIVRMQLEQGITRFKAATIAEAEMAASCEAPDVLLAYQPVGPNGARLLRLVQMFPTTRFAAVVDDLSVVRQLSDLFTAADRVLEVFVDVDCGMHRTGAAPDDRAVQLYKEISRSSGLKVAGLHAYDGHIHDADPVVRKARCEAAFGPVHELRARLIQAGLSVPIIVAGGTPTFPFHASRPDVECSPGTCLLWDAGYGHNLPDLDFLPAALVLTRVVSKPGPERLCLDLGHKAIAAENPHPRVELLELPER